VVLGCRCGVELVVCVSVVRVCVCFWVVVWFFGAVFEWAFGCQRACGVCSRLLEMADVSAIHADGIAYIITQPIPVFLFPNLGNLPLFGS